MIRIESPELEKIMRDYHANKNNSGGNNLRTPKRKQSKNIPTDEERAELIKKYLEPPKKVKLTFIDKPLDSYIKHEKERHIPVPASTLKPAGIKRVEQKRPIQRMRDYSKYEKYSGITPGGDSGHEPRKEDWNDDIARNFQKELRKARSFRRRMGWDGVDCGALK